jgi:NAD-dependent dihydropyrimidine dehydrogenase PreA subunit
MLKTASLNPDSAGIEDQKIKDEKNMPPVVDEAKCNGCGTCVDVCPSECFTLEDNISKVTDPDACVDCESCVENCAEEAIVLK